MIQAGLDGGPQEAPPHFDSALNVPVVGTGFPGLPPTEALELHRGFPAGRKVVLRTPAGRTPGWFRGGVVRGA